MLSHFRGQHLGSERHWPIMAARRPRSRTRFSRYRNISRMRRPFLQNPPKILLHHVRLLQHLPIPEPLCEYPAR